MTSNKAATNSLVERLNEISSWVSSSQDLEKLLGLILETASGILKVKAGAILLLDERTKKIEKGLKDAEEANRKLGEMAEKEKVA